MPKLTICGALFCCCLSIDEIHTPGPLNDVLALICSELQCSCCEVQCFVLQMCVRKCSKDMRERERVREFESATQTQRISLSTETRGEVIERDKIMTDITTFGKPYVLACISSVSPKTVTVFCVYSNLICVK